MQIPACFSKRQFQRYLRQFGVAAFFVVIVVGIVLASLKMNDHLEQAAASAVDNVGQTSCYPSSRQSVGSCVETDGKDDDTSGVSDISSFQNSPSPSLSMPVLGQPSFSSPSGQNSALPYAKLSASPSAFSSTQASNITYVPGLLTKRENGLMLSEGLTSRIIAQTDLPVTYENGEKSELLFHGRPDFGATFEDQRPENPGGWVYVSNSELENNHGGVGALTFDAEGNIIDYRRLLSGTNKNCGGGRTPWNTWISCEEADDGKIYQVDPFGVRDAAPVTLGSDGGRWESFAYDVRDLEQPLFFVTEDHELGALRRFKPSSPNWNIPWEILQGDGEINYLVLEPNNNSTGGTYRWVLDKATSRQNAKQFYPNSEGIDIDGSTLYFVCKKVKQLFQLDLDGGTYVNKTTVNGLFDGQPDQLQRIVGQGDYGLLYFTEEGGKNAGIHARNSNGDFIAILEGPDYDDETTGLAFSPDEKHLYVAYQENGVLFDVTRSDGHPFGAKTLNLKYHAENRTYSLSTFRNS